MATRVRKINTDHEKSRHAVSPFLHLVKDDGGGRLYMRGHLCDGLAIPMAAIKDCSMNFRVGHFLPPIK